MKHDWSSLTASELSIVTAGWRAASEGRQPDALRSPLWLMGWHEWHNTKPAASAPARVAVVPAPTPVVSASRLGDTLSLAAELSSRLGRGWVLTEAAPETARLQRALAQFLSVHEVALRGQPQRKSTATPDHSITEIAP